MSPIAVGLEMAWAAQARPVSDMYPFNVSTLVSGMKIIRQS
jgi:hypothetical protein